jgi:hypothetical protein
MTDIRTTVDRLSALNYERVQLRRVLWERIVPFAARSTYSTYSDISDVDEAWLRKPDNASVDFRILSDANDNDDPDFRVEISVNFHAADGGEAYIEVCIPRYLFFATDEDFESFWAKRRGAEHAAEEELSRLREEAERVATEAQHAKKEASDRELYEQLKARFGS